MIRAALAAALSGLIACTAAGHDDPPPAAPAPVSVPAPEATAFPPFATVARLAPIVANLSATSCLVAWPAETAEYRATFLFRTDDGGASFRAIGDVGGTASEVVALEGRIWLLQHYSGGGILPVIEYSDDGGLTWNAHGAVEAAVSGGASLMNEVDRMSFRDRLVGKARWNDTRWLETADGGDTWRLVPSEPTWVAAPAVDGLCRADGAALQRRTASGTWEPVPGAPGG